ncbi:MAG: 30S ribosomal protein S6 [Patescibacteria group bacterium]|nr:30S ribosomal protein S6 [Patescibacteria group bacterium]
MAKNKDNVISHYEMLYIVSNQYTEDEVKPIVDGVNKTIEKYDGKITYSEVWGKKKFCYPINHKHHGYYFLVEFDLVGSKINKFDRETGFNAEIVRHMIVAKKLRSVLEIEEEKRVAEGRAKAKIKQAEEKEIKEEKKEKKEKSKSKKAVDLEDLDAKLDKILDTDDLL